MLLPVCVDAAGNEWSLVELQGELLGAERLGGVEIGSLRFAGGAPTLRVGNHILAGKVAPLAKPFAVLHKTAGGDGGEVRYEVVGVARTRLVFATRPKPVLE